MIQLDSIPLKPTPATAWIAGFILAAKHTNPALTADSIIEDEAAHAMMPRGRKKIVREVGSGRNVAKGEAYGIESLDLR